MKIGNTVIEFGGEQDANLMMAIWATVGIPALVWFLICILNHQENAEIRSSVEKLYCLEHTDLTADECDRLF